jgi:hypothetical protein
MIFQSKFKEISYLQVPKNTGIRIMMMPIIIGDINSIPSFLFKIKDFIIDLCRLSDFQNQIGYLTIDSKSINSGDTHRRSGLHVDGVHNGSIGGWGGGGGGWGSVGNGMITVSDEIGCRAWNKEFEGEIGPEGECDHFSQQAILSESTLFKKNIAYWVDGLCVHESIKQDFNVNRTFVRLSNPSDAPWFEGYTRNPTGVEPSGKILGKRKFMYDGK